MVRHYILARHKRSLWNVSLNHFFGCNQHVYENLGPSVGPIRCNFPVGQKEFIKMPVACKGLVENKGLLDQEMGLTFKNITIKWVHFGAMKNKEEYIYHCIYNQDYQLRFIQFNISTIYIRIMVALINLVQPPIIKNRFNERWILFVTSRAPTISPS